jgi:ankyrin repeat protein
MNTIRKHIFIFVVTVVSATVFGLSLYASLDFQVSITSLGIFLITSLLLIGLDRTYKQQALNRFQKIEQEYARQNSPVAQFINKTFSKVMVKLKREAPQIKLTKSVDPDLLPNKHFSENELVQAATAIANADLTTLDIQIRSNPTIVYGKNSQGMTLLHYAMFFVSKEIVTKLIDNKADVNAIYTEHTPLYVTKHTPLSILLDTYTQLGAADAEEQKIIELVERLHSSGANLNSEYDFGLRPSVFYVKKDWQSKVLIRLVQLGADINARGFAGRTLIYETISSNPEWKQTQFLISLGADPKVTAEDGSTPGDKLCDWVTGLKEKGQFVGAWKESATTVYQQLKSMGVAPKCEM